MPTFPTPEPIAATVEIVGDLRLTASDRADTVVTVRPANPAKPADVKAAEQTTVELADGKLLVKSLKSWRQYAPFGDTGMIDVAIELPTGSTVVGHSALGRIAGDGELGDSRLKTAMGNIRLDHTGALRADTGHGDVTVDHIAGDAQITTGSGDIVIEAIDGAATIKNSNGPTTIGTVAGELRAKAANGDVTVGRAETSASAKSANGDVRFAQVRSGAIVLETAMGELEVGIRQGTAAWLDVNTRFGKVRNHLGTTEAPAPSDDRVEVRARTSFGDIVITSSPVQPDQTDTTDTTDQGSDAR